MPLSRLRSGVFAVLLLAPGAAAAGEVVDYFDRLASNRGEITSGVFEVTVSYLTCLISDEYEHATEECRIWFDKRGYRVDLDQKRPKTPAEAFHARMAFRDGTYRIITNDVPSVAVLEFPTEQIVGGGEPQGIPVSRIDPRLFGVYARPFHAMNDSKLSNLHAFKDRATLDSQPTAIAGHAVTLFTARFPNGGRSVYEVRDGNMMPSRIKSHAPSREIQGKRIPEITTEAFITLASARAADGTVFEIPTRIKVKTDHDGRTVLDEIIDVRVKGLNCPIDESVFDWSGLKPKVGARLIRNNQFSDLITWDGSEFKLQRPGQPQTSGADAKRAFDRKFLRLVAVNLIGGAVLLAGFIIARKRGTRKH